MIKLIKGEILKIKISIILLFISVLIGFHALNQYGFFYDFQNKYWREVSVTQDYNPWHFFINDQSSQIEIIIGLFMLVSLTWLQYQELKTNMWSRLFLFPQSIFKIIGSKIILVFMASFFLYVLFFLCSFGIIRPIISNYYSSFFSDKYFEDMNIYIRWIIIDITSILKFIIFQTWLTIKFKQHYLAAFSIGVVGMALSFIRSSPYYFRFWSHLPVADSVIYSTIYAFLFIYFIFKELKNGYF